MKFGKYFDNKKVCSGASNTIMNYLPFRNGHNWVIQKRFFNVSSIQLI